MIHSSDIKGLPELFSARVRGVARGEEYVAVAQSALEVGFDTPNTLRLAIEEPPFFTPDLDATFQSMLKECGVPEPTPAAALIAHAQLVALQILSGTLHPLDGAKTISEIFTPDFAPPGFGAWTEISEGLTCEHCRESATGEHPSFEAAIRAEAESVLRAAV